MPTLRICLLALALSAGLATPAHAIVNGTNASPGEYPYVAKITIDGAFGCTGTLVTPTTVISAAHCASLVPGGVANVPIGQPGQLIEVSIGAYAAPFDDGEHHVARSVAVAPGYLGLNSVREDVSVITLDTPSSKPTVKIANASERSLWSAGTTATIAGYGVTESEGDPPAILQEAQVPIRTDADAAAAYPYLIDGVDPLAGGFESGTQLAAGDGRADTCQGDSGGPLLVPAPSGGFRLVGDTSYGVGCADPDYPGIYGRLAGDTLRTWIASVAPGAIASTSTTSTGGSTTTSRKTKTTRTTSTSAKSTGVRSLR